jgi:hypothetical protein
LAEYSRGWTNRILDWRLSRPYCGAGLLIRCVVVDFLVRSSEGSIGAVAAVADRAGGVDRGAGQGELRPLRVSNAQEARVLLISSLLGGLRHQLSLVSIADELEEV